MNQTLLVHNFFYNSQELIKHKIICRYYFASKNIIISLNVSGCGRAVGYMEVMDLLEKSQPFYYLEESKKLDDLIYEIVAEYKTGIISLMNRKYKSGLKTVGFNPNKNSMILVLTRDQIEASDKLFEYIGPILSIK